MERDEWLSKVRDLSLRSNVLVSCWASASSSLLHSSSKYVDLAYIQCHGEVGELVGSDSRILSRWCAPVYPHPAYRI